MRHAQQVTDDLDRDGRGEVLDQIAAAFGIMLLGKGDALLVERARMALADALAPIWGAVQEPVAAVRGAVQNADALWNLRAENARLTPLAADIVCIAWVIALIVSVWRKISEAFDDTPARYW